MQTTPAQLLVSCLILLEPVHQRTAVVWEQHSSQPFFCHPSCTGLVCFFFVVAFFPLYPLTFEEFVVEETIMVDSMHGPPRCIFSWKFRNHIISKNPNDVGHTEGLLMEEIRPTSPGMYNTHRKYHG